jgi:hypothetical protein
MYIGIVGWVDPTVFNRDILTRPKGKDNLRNSEIYILDFAKMAFRAIYVFEYAIIAKSRL